MLDPLLAGTDQVSSAAIWTALGKEACARDNRDADRVASILQRYGFNEQQSVPPIARGSASAGLDQDKQDKP